MEGLELKKRGGRGGEASLCLRSHDLCWTKTRANIHKNVGFGLDVFISFFLNTPLQDEDSLSPPLPP